MTKTHLVFVNEGSLSLSILFPFSAGMTRTGGELRWLLGVANTEI